MPRSVYHLACSRSRCVITLALLVSCWRYLQLSLPAIRGCIPRSPRLSGFGQTEEQLVLQAFTLNWEALGSGLTSFGGLQPASWRSIHQWIGGICGETMRFWDLRAPWIEP